MAHRLPVPSGSRTDQHPFAGATVALAATGCPMPSVGSTKAPAISSAATAPRARSCKCRGH